MPAACHFYDLPAFSLPPMQVKMQKGREQKLFTQLYDFPTHILQ
jgi:hypothetical protein